MFAFVSRRLSLVSLKQVKPLIKRLRFVLAHWGLITRYLQPIYKNFVVEMDVAHKNRY